MVTQEAERSEREIMTSLADRVERTGVRSLQDYLSRRTYMSRICHGATCAERWASMLKPQRKHIRATGLPENTEPEYAY